MTTAVLVPSAAVAAPPTSKPKSAVVAAAVNNNNPADDVQRVEEQAKSGREGCSNSAVPTGSNNQEGADDELAADNENTNSCNVQDTGATAPGNGNKQSAFMSATRAAATAMAHHLKRCQSAPVKTESSSNKTNKKRRRVSFESAEIVEFEPTVFTTTVTSGGLPVGMSLQERSRSRRRLDSWEMERQDMRVGRQNYMEEGYLDPTEREVILCNAGCAEQSMLSVEAEVNQIIADRRESNEVDFDFLYGLVSIGEEEEDEEDEEEEEEEEDEEEEEEDDDAPQTEDIEEVELMSDFAERGNQDEERESSCRFFSFLRHLQSPNFTCELMVPPTKRPRDPSSGEEEEKTGEGATALALSSGPARTSSDRGKDFRARRRQHEESLRTRVGALRFQIADLHARRTIWHAKLLFTERSDTGSLAQLIRHYYSLFRFGMETPRADTTDSARLHMRHQESFMHQIMDVDAETGETKGPVSSMNQWRLYRAAHASFMGEVGSIEISGPEETPTVVLQSKYHVRLSRATFQIMFPHAAGNEELVSKFLYKPVVYNCVSRFHFSREGKIDYEVVDVGIVEAFVRAGFRMKDIAELMQLSVLSPQCTIQETTTTSAGRSKPRQSKPPSSTTPAM